ncbi:Protein piwi [Orchesella cincta]|uniref:Protein piwi n=1 Tax=Orchesella cincta TaxID=48709 RepID=A0A1D2NAN7_ORCCI|nr:Protein piwi [Orchesella cincta]
MNKCCHNFLALNGELPERIIIYRDGVGDGQLQAVNDSELKKLNGGRTPPLLTYVVVSKRVNTRLMMMKMNLQNPPPGTVVDEVVTLPERFVINFYKLFCVFLSVLL